MDNQPIRDAELWEALEACRPGHNDLAEPEMAALARQLAESPKLAKAHARLQRLDAALAHAFRDVPVPEGLEARILERLKAEPEAIVPRMASPEVTLPGREDRPLRRGRTPGQGVSRRRWLMFAGGAAATAAAVLITVVGPLGRRGEFNKSEVLDAAIERHLSDAFAEGRVLGAIPPSNVNPLSPTLMGLVSGRVSQVRWRPVSGFLNRHAVAYDFLGPDGRIATVYVASCTVDGLPGHVPPHPMHSTGETSVSAWQEGDLVYVLVVGGGVRAYERLLSPVTGPLA